MKLLVDTFNVLHRTGILPAELAGIDPPGLASLISRSRYRDREAWLILDGALRGRSAMRRVGPVRYFHAGPSRTADDVIAKLVLESSAPKSILVVSSDRQVQAAGRKRRCRIIDSDTFLTQLTHDASSQSSSPEANTPRRPTGKLKATETDHWLHTFGLNDELQDIKPSTLPKTPAPKRPPSPKTKDQPKSIPPMNVEDEGDLEGWMALDTAELLRRFERGVGGSD